MILVRRRYATHNVVSPLVPALKGRAKVRGPLRGPKTYAALGENTGAPRARLCAIA
jgi:hypothetical protein